MPAKKDFDPYHLRSQQIADFLAVSLRSFYEKEDEFAPIPRDAAGRRHMTVIDAARLYRAWWGRPPMPAEIKEFFVSQGSTVDKAQLWIDILKGHGLFEKVER
jgi:hypothetical protein